MLELANGELNLLTVLSITPVEFRSALRRRERRGDIENEVAEQILQAFAGHLETRFLQQPLTDMVLGTAMKLIDSHGLRAYDAMQLAGCLALRTSSDESEPVLVCADKSLTDVARDEELQTLDPTVGITAR